MLLHDLFNIYIFFKNCKVWCAYWCKTILFVFQKKKKKNTLKKYIPMNEKYIDIFIKREMLKENVIAKREM